MYKPVFFLKRELELESCFSCTFSKLRYTSVIDIAAAVKYNCFDALSECLLSNSLTNVACSFLVGTDALECCLDGRCGDKGNALYIVDDLSINVLIGTVNSESGALCSTGNLSTYSCVSLKALLVLILL